MKIIARIESDFKSKFGIPRQSGIVDELRAKVIFEPEYRVAEAFRGIEEYSHLWLIWEFSENVGKPWSPTVRPPRLGGNTRYGVFATRSPFRPNPIGISCVRLEKVEFSTPRGPVLTVRGADLLDGTPIYDIKPYSPMTDSHPEAVGGIADKNRDFKVEVDFPQELKEKVSPELFPALVGVLEGDPRPSYHSDPERVYGMSFADLEVKFTVSDGVLKVIDIEKQVT